jgi:diaminohydroxyphosphoribosylaminopyrimidine deaminase/5-amino-6-(5-phosphoribosylamino)uracil reductase
MKAVNKNIIMQRCLELARNGAGMVNPNPMVGCVIVRNGKIVGEGFHKKFGGPHAEIFALKRAGNKTKGATLYVSLEPCAHFGKTPPCTDAIIQARISQVVIASKDPNPFVSGKGIRRLRGAGIQVKVGLLQKEAKLLNEKFFKFMKTALPFVGLRKRSMAELPMLQENQNGLHPELREKKCIACAMNMTRYWLERIPFFRIIQS